MARIHLLGLMGVLLLAPARATPPTVATGATVGPVAPAVVVAPERPKINHVLIISEDGLRYDAVEKLHLKWHELLRKHGTWASHALTIRDASTLPAHASMLSGVGPHVHGL